MQVFSSTTSNIARQSLAIVIDGLMQFDSPFNKEIDVLDIPNIVKSKGIR
jgi:hypothetical protein